MEELKCLKALMGKFSSMCRPGQLCPVARNSSMDTLSSKLSPSLLFPFKLIPAPPYSCTGNPSSGQDHRKHWSSGKGSLLAEPLPQVLCCSPSADCREQQTEPRASALLSMSGGKLGAVRFPPCVPWTVKPRVWRGEREGGRVRIRVSAGTRLQLSG